MKKVLLDMYLRKNLGDDLFLWIISRRYNDVQFNSTMKRDYFGSFGLKNVHGRSFLSRFISKIKRDVLGIYSPDRKNNAKVMLGGSIFMDKGLNKEELADAMEKRYSDKLPLFVIGANFGPYDNKFYLDNHKKLFTKAEDVCFREKYSANLFKDLNNVRVAPDIVFGLDVKNYLAKQEKKVIISVINLEKRESLKKHLKDYEDKIAEMADNYSDMGYKVVLMSFCKYEGDEEAINRIIARTLGNNIEPCFYRGDIDDALKQIASAEIIVGTRFHSVVLGITFEKKVLPIIYSDKTRHILDDIKFKGDIIDISNISSFKISRLVRMPTRYTRINILRKESEQHFAKLDEFLGRIKK